MYQVYMYHFGYADCFWQQDAVEATRMDLSYRNMNVRATYRDKDGLSGNA